MREVAMVLVVHIVVIASMQTRRGVIMLRESVFATLDGEVKHIKTIFNVKCMHSNIATCTTDQSPSIFHFARSKMRFNM